ncbi:hypothetical protein [Mesorhizobium sp. BH1-1-4]|uniref:hypothetical protein n=1 Tax=Mesorhizobium sp. BH1-1-4 TaxID=2876662 RepID=UPI001CD088F3|nr:hypothetical protein [Mesorhizobium sp. BH1-1-4]MBZ9997473.1 hypothetical protein [Mesorhizobium sp. BH1-1-4]
MPTLNQTKSVLSLEKATERVEDQIDDMLKWYWKETQKLESWTWWLQVSGLFLAFLTTVVAAYPSDDKMVKWAVVILSAAATLVSGFLYRTGIERAAHLREQGRIKLSAIKQRTILQLSQEPMTVEEQASRILQIVDVMQDVDERFGVHLSAAARTKGRSAA